MSALNMIEEEEIDTCEECGEDVEECECDVVRDTSSTYIAKTEMGRPGEEKWVLPGDKIVVNSRYAVKNGVRTTLFSWRHTLCRGPNWSDFFKDGFKSDDRVMVDGKPGVITQIYDHSMCIDFDDASGLRIYYGHKIEKI